jgi:adenine-specific DNA-methyltransferase
LETRRPRVVSRKEARTAIVAAHQSDVAAVLYHGDCQKLLEELPDSSIDLTITSPPYCMGKAYEPWRTIDEFKEAHARILPQIVRATRDGGSVCWQVGSFVRKNEVLPLDYLLFDLFRELPEMKLRNRIVWTFGHGKHCTNRFSGRHETILWFTKGDQYAFDLDKVRVPQKYPGKKHYKGPRKGEFSGNPLGKNPGDVWEIPHVKSKHVEKTNHPCQFPIALPQRLIRALCPLGGVVLDPFSGVGSTGAACMLENRRFIGAETDDAYAKVAEARIKEAMRGTLQYRPAERPIFIPTKGLAVAKRPSHFGVQ